MKKKLKKRPKAVQLTILTREEEAVIYGGGRYRKYHNKTRRPGARFFFEDGQLDIHQAMERVRGNIKKVPYEAPDALPPKGSPEHRGLVRRVASGHKYHGILEYLEDYFQGVIEVFRTF